MKTNAIAAPARRRISATPQVSMELVKPVTEHEPERPDPNLKYLDGCEAYKAMLEGKVVRRLAPTNVWAKFHRLNPANKDVQTAETANKMVQGEWERAQTDVASWFFSKFAVVTLETVQVKIKYQ
jgi:hypothetical protein